MVDFRKRVAKSGLLDPDEQVVAAVPTMPAGAMGAAVGGVVGAAIGESMARRERGDQNDSEGEAATFPRGGTQFIALTDKRLVVLDTSAMSGKPKSIAGSYPLERVADVSLDKRLTTSSLKVAFVDGSAVTVTVHKRAKGKDLTEGFRQLRGA